MQSDPIAQTAQTAQTARTARTAPTALVATKFSGLIPITWFFVFQPYLSPFPTSNDLQPTSLVLAGGILLLQGAVRGRLPSHFLFSLALAASIEFIHLALFGSLAFIYIATYVYVVFAWKYVQHITPKMIWVVLIFHLFGIVWQTIDPGSFAAAFESFLREIKYSGNSGRGASGFAPEPSFSSALSTVYALVYFRFFSLKQDRVANSFFFMLYFLTIALTSSALGYFFLPFVVATWLLRGRRNFAKCLQLVALTFVFMALAVGFLEFATLNQRGLVLAKTLIQNPAGFLMDASLQERFRSLYIGFQAMFSHPLGFGHGNFALATEWAVEHRPIHEMFPTSRNIQGSASGVGRVMAGAGLLGAFFYLWIFVQLRRKSQLQDIGIWVVSVAMFVFSFSPAFPLIYTLLVMRLKNVCINIH